MSTIAHRSRKPAYIFLSRQNLSMSVPANNLPELPYNVIRLTFGDAATSTSWPMYPSIRWGVPYERRLSRQFLSSLTDLEDAMLVSTPVARTRELLTTVHERPTWTTTTGRSRMMQSIHLDPTPPKIAKAHRARSRRLKLQPSSATGTGSPTPPSQSTPVHIP